MTSEIENFLAMLMAEIGHLEADIANSGRAGERLATIKQLVETFEKQNILGATTEDITQRRVFIGEAITPLYLMSIYRDYMGIQADQLAAPYLNKWMKLSGTVDEIHAYRDSVSVRAEIDPGGEDSLHTNYHFLEFRDQKSKQRIKMLRRGDSFSFIGRVEIIYATELRFEDCEIAASASS
jgi:hypothetical protein